MKIQPKGFAIKPAPKIEQMRYYVELKKRYVLTDNSELLLGRAFIQVPKALHDSTGDTPKKRDVWDCFAIGVCQYFLLTKQAQEKKVNAIWLFKGNAKPGDEPIDRIEINPWNERGQACVDQGVVDDFKAEVAGRAFQQCQFEVQWLDTPVVA